MKSKTMTHIRGLMVVGVCLALCEMAQASWVTDPDRWVTIGNPGNAAQSEANRDHTAHAGDGYGAVSYTYQISKYAVSIADWQAYYTDGDSGKVGSFNETYDYWSAVGMDAPAVRISFHQAAQYANWLTTGDASSGAYTINTSGEVTAIDRNTNARNTETGLLYVLPSDDEWFKAAYFNGTTGTYTLFANDSNDVPPKSGDGTTGWNYDNALAPSQPWTVDLGTEEQNGTFNMMGNVFEWMEDTEGWGRGGAYDSFFDFNLRSSVRGGADASGEYERYGLRVVAIPEPGTAGIMVLTALGALGIRRLRRLKRGYEA